MAVQAQQRGFSFARGNLAKLAALPRYALGALGARFVVRDPGLWAVGSAFGVADGAWAFVRAAGEADPGLRLVWLAATPQEAADARGQGLEAVLKDSPEGFRTTLRASVVTVTHGFGDANRYALTGAVIVQLWHGSPLKKLLADSPAMLQLGGLGRIPGAPGLLRWLARRATSRISLLPVASRRFVPSLCTAFALGPDRVLPLGEPRTDVLFAGTPQQRRQAARALLSSLLGELGDTRVLLYAPTWRDGEPDPGVPTAAQWRRIDEFCAATGSLLVVRPHPLGIGGYTHRSAHVRLLGSDVQAESMPLLWGVDVLITDYSSMVFDFAVTGGPIVFLAPDLEHYAATRGLYLSYPEVSGGSWQTDWDQVLDRLRSLDADPEASAAATRHSRRLAEQFHEHTDGRNAERVVAAARTLSAAAASGRRSLRRRRTSP